MSGGASMKLYGWPSTKLGNVIADSYTWWVSAASLKMFVKSLATVSVVAVALVGTPGWNC